jgi:type II secretion system protein I
VRSRTGIHERGFTLVEVLAALVILAATAAAVYQSFGTGSRALGIADGEATAVMIAEARLAETGAASTLAARRASGTTSDGYAWSVERERYGAITDIAPPADRTVALPDAYWVTVTVTWRPSPGAASRRISLRTLKIEEPRR